MDDYRLHDKQCLYIFDWIKGGVTFEIGLKKLLGYAVDELYLEDIMGLVHPDDRYLVEKITKEAFQHTYRDKKVDTRLFITYRFMKKDGSYIKLMKQTSSYKLDRNGKMISNISILTDITFMGNQEKVDWELQASNLDLNEFKEKIYHIYRKLFTSREKDILQLLNKKLTSEQIAIRLHLSRHNVQTHRKNIMRRAKSQSIHDVLSFCKKNGILE